MKKQIKLVVAAFAIMLVGVTSAFAKNPGDPVKVSEFKPPLGVYEGEGFKMEFVDDGGNVKWKWLEWNGKSRSDTYRLHWANNDPKDDLMRVYHNGTMTFFFRFANGYNRIVLVDYGDLYVRSPSGAVLLAGILNDWSNADLLKRINDGADVNYKSCGTTPLHEAARTGNFPLARKLVEKGADRNAKDKNGKTPVDVAKGKGHTELANYLSNPKSLKSPTDPDPLIIAANKGDLATVKKQVSLGVDVNAHSKSDGWTALTAAAMNGHEDVVDYLLREGADVNEPLNNPNTGVTATALYYAARGGYQGIIDSLLSAGADANAKHSKTGMTPSQIAKENGYTLLAEYLKGKAEFQRKRH